ncbi:MAG: DinB family protein, partial [Thermomicrobiales bacterium]|nr:DinB family protein [Thermomicrobiales bacterium]
PDRGVWTTDDDGGWTAHDVLVHLRASAEILTPRIMQILVRDVPPLPAFDERRWAEVGGFHAMSPDELFARIAIPRYELIQVLRRLGRDDWARTGLHEQHGKIGLEAIVAHLAGHEEEHLAQIRDLLAAGR